MIFAGFRTDLRNERHLCKGFLIIETTFFSIVKGVTFNVPLKKLKNPNFIIFSKSKSEKMNRQEKMSYKHDVNTDFDF